MTVLGDSNRVDLVGNGSSTIFNMTNILVFDESEITVFLDAVLQTITTDYTVSGLNDPNGAVVTFVVAPPNLDPVILIREVPVTQLTAYPENDDFPSAAHEAALDRAIMALQQFQEVLDRAITIPQTSGLSNIEIPDPANTAIAGFLLRYNLASTGFDAVDPTFTSDGVVTTEGDIIRGGTGGVAERLAVGNADDILVVAAGNVAYESLVARAAKLVTPLGALDHGQCQLIKSGANLRLDRYNGQYILIKTGSVWQLRSIPASGPTLAATALTPSTVYYIYLYDSSGTLTLEASTTAYATDADTGVKIKTGDATRTLVGMARPVTGPVWSDSLLIRGTRSWFNDPGVYSEDTDTGNRSSSSATYVTIDAGWDIDVLVWAGERVSAQMSMGFATSSSGNGVFASLGLDGINQAGDELITGDSNSHQTLATHRSRTLSEDNHNWQGIFHGDGAVSAQARNDLTDGIISVLTGGNK